MAEVYEITRTALYQLIDNLYCNPDFAERHKQKVLTCEYVWVSCYCSFENVHDWGLCVVAPRNGMTLARLCDGIETMERNDLYALAYGIDTYAHEYEVWHIVDDEPEPDAARYELRLYDKAGEPVRCITSPTFETLADAIGAAELLAEFGLGFRRVEVWDMRETDRSRAWRYGVSCW